MRMPTVVDALFHLAAEHNERDSRAAYNLKSLRVKRVGNNF